MPTKSINSAIIFVIHVNAVLRLGAIQKKGFSLHARAVRASDYGPFFGTFAVLFYFDMKHGVYIL